MLKLSRCFLVLALAMGLGSQSVLAASHQEVAPAASKKVIFPMNGASGFVFQKLKPVSTINSLMYDMIIVDSSRELTSSQIKQLQAYLDKGIAIVIDAKEGATTAQKVAEDLVGFGLNSNAIMIEKNRGSAGGYNVTPITAAQPKPKTVSNLNMNTTKVASADSMLQSSKVVNKEEAPVSNTVNDIFGL
ncbi:hypothetical protein [Acinetobacter apis]|uniref:Uncharacterized protein n=1 Tax=Acinetobacter apis TaxID=1229165 RepID=A0A217ECS3_9GAMM|nr:hypothetical protein [Acinetobacter apis]SNQ28261.1 hypothetical protein SAMN05444584_0175 [Acinetobacter apis]